MGCAGVLTDALAEVGVKKLSKIPANQGRGVVIVSGEVAGDVLGKAAVAISKAATPHKNQAPPSLSLEVLLPGLDEKSAAVARQALAKVDGVDAEKSKANTKLGVLAVRLAGGKNLTVTAILTALEKAGLKPKLAPVPDIPAKLPSEDDETPEKK